MKWMILIPLALASCSMTDEQGSRGGQIPVSNVEGGLLAGAPDTYRFRHWQMGGVVQWQNSMGSSLTADNQASWKDFMQMTGTVAGGILTYKAALASEITKRFQAGQLTQQQASQLQAQVALAQTEKDLALGLAQLQHLSGQ